MTTDEPRSLEIRGRWVNILTHTHTHTRLTALSPGLPGWAGTRKVKPVWLSLKQEAASGSGISWAICKSAPRSRQITMPAPHHSVFLQAGCPFCRPTNSVKALKAMSKHFNTATNWRQVYTVMVATTRIAIANRFNCPIAIKQMSKILAPMPSYRKLNIPDILNHEAIAIQWSGACNYTSER